MWGFEKEQGVNRILLETECLCPPWNSHVGALIPVWIRIWKTKSSKLNEKKKRKRKEIKNGEKRKKNKIK